MPTPAERAAWLMGKIPTDQEFQDLIEGQIKDAIRDDRRERERDQLRQAAPQLLDLVKAFMRASTMAELSAAQQQGYGVLRMAGDG